MLAQDSTQAEWIAHYPGTDIQQLRALIRQARKDAPTENNTTVSQGLAPRKGRAYRELFALVREHVSGTRTEEPDTADDEDSDDE